MTGQRSLPAVAERTAVNRRRLADFFERLDPAQLSTASLCADWSVREVLAHLAMPWHAGLARLLWETARHRGSIDRASVTLARQLATHDLHELTSSLREHAETRVRAPGVGPMGQLVDGCIHLRDCARPLGVATDVPLQDWRMVLTWLPSRQARRGVVPSGRLDGLRLRATDQDWSWSEGAEVAGPSEALAMAVAGRPAALDDLTGPGHPILAARIQ